MKETIKLLCCVAVLAMFFAGCTEPAVDSGISGNENDNKPNSLPALEQVYQEDGTTFLTQSGDVYLQIAQTGGSSGTSIDDAAVKVGTITNGKLAYTLPATPIADQFLMDLMTSLGSSSQIDLAATPTEIMAFPGMLYFKKTGDTSITGALSYVNQLYLTALSDSGEEEDTYGSTIGSILYSKAAGTITGNNSGPSDDGYAASINLVQGWNNWLYVTDTSFRVTTMTTTKPEGMKWVFESGTGHH